MTQETFLKPETGLYTETETRDVAGKDLTPDQIREWMQAWWSDADQWRMLDRDHEETFAQICEAMKEDVKEPPTATTVHWDRRLISQEIDP